MISVNGLTHDSGFDRLSVLGSRYAMGAGGPRARRRSALRAVRQVRHLGLSFASKHLRLLRPDVCPVLDSTLSEKLGYPLDSRGYQRFTDDCQKLAALLNRLGVPNPLGREGGRWFVADVEMALFVYVKESSR